MSGDSKTEPRAGMARRLRNAWARDAHLSLLRRLQKAAQFATQLLRAKVELRSCNRIGRSARVAGRLRVENPGNILIGDHLNINSSWVPTELLTGPMGQIAIGDDVLINFGTVIAAARAVSIGSGSMIGPHCIISDLDLPEQVPTGAAEDARPIHIGRDVWLAGRVTVRPGVRIGDGAVIVAGSIVESDVPAHVMASGIPARLLPKLGSASRPSGAVRSAFDGTEAATGAPWASPARRPLAGDLIADFPTDDLANELRLPDMFPALTGRAVAWPGAMSSTLPVPAADADDYALVWTRPQAAAPCFARVLEEVDLAGPAAVREVLAEVDGFCTWVERVAGRYAQVFVPTWTLPAHFRGHGYRDLRPGGVAAVLAEMNLRLMNRLGAAANVHILDAARWLAAVGPAASNPRAWYLGRMPMARPFVAEAARDVRAAMAALQGQSRRLLVVGFEGTLSLGGAGAVIGAASTETLASRAEMAARADVLRGLRRLAQGGVALGVIAREREAVVRDAMRATAGALLCETDIAGWHCGSDDESAGIAALAARLSLPLRSVVFVDPVAGTRARVRERLPAVYVPDWPGDRLLQPAALLALRCFDPAYPPAVVNAGDMQESAA